MAEPTNRLPAGIHEYLSLTRRPLNCLAFILVPLVVYHVLAPRYAQSLSAAYHIGWLLRYFGATADVLPPLLVVVVLLVQHWTHKHPWKIQPIALGGMLVESALWVLPLFSLHFYTDQFLTALKAGGAQSLTTEQILFQGLGAGIYEEFLFRLVLVSLTLLILVDVLALRKDVAATLAVLVGAVLFALYHLTQKQLAGADAISWGLFSFRVLAGAYMGWLYIWRGFGVAVGTHACWNICAALVRG